MVTRYPDSRNRRSIEDGAAFERYVIERLGRSGIALTFSDSQAAQYTYGDTLEGIEIKLDARADDTHRLSIEVAERTAMHRPWVTSGIFADHRAHRYAQGTQRRFWVFTIATLRDYYHRVRPEIIDDNPPTIRKFYVPVNVADRIAESVWTPIPNEWYTTQECDVWLIDHGYTRGVDGRWIGPTGVRY